MRERYLPLSKLQLPQEQSNIVCGEPSVSSILRFLWKIDKAWEKLQRVGDGAGKFWDQNVRIQEVTRLYGTTSGLRGLLPTAFC